MLFSSLLNLNMYDIFRFAFRNDEETKTKFLESIERIAKGTFSNINRIIDVGWIDAASVVKDSGAYRKVLKDMENLYHISQLRISAYDAIHFELIVQEAVKKCNGTFQSLIWKFKEVLKNFNKYNSQFNIVWYAQYSPTVRR